MKLLTTTVLAMLLLASCGRSRSNNNGNVGAMNQQVWGVNGAQNGAQWFNNCQRGFNNYQFGNTWGNPYGLGTWGNPYAGFNAWGGVGVNPFGVACP